MMPRTEERGLDLKTRAFNDWIIELHSHMKQILPDLCWRLLFYGDPVVVFQVTLNLGLSPPHGCHMPVNPATPHVRPALES